MSSPDTSDFYCGNSIPLARNQVVYSISPAPWSPYAPNAIDRAQTYVKQVSDMTPTELRQVVACALRQFLDDTSVQCIVDEVSDNTLQQVITNLNAPPPEESQ